VQEALATEVMCPGQKKRSGTRVTLERSPAIDDGPRWSPDGPRILFNSSRDGRFGVYLMDSQGGDIRHLTQDHRMNVLSPAAAAANGVLRLAIAPVWSPDGLRIAFDSTRDGNYDSYTMAVDGSDVR
jgi:Tol biopolymer transport system component